MSPRRRPSAVSKKSAIRHLRRLFSEQLEERRLLAVDIGHNLLLEEFLQEQHSPELRSLVPVGDFRGIDGTEVAEQIISTELEFLGANPDDFQVSYDYVSEQTGVDLTYLQQTHEGLEVLNAFANVSVWDGGAVINAFSSFVTPEVDPAKTLVLEPGEALQALSDKFDWSDEPIVVTLENDADLEQQVLIAEEVADEPIPVEMAYAPTEDGTIELVYRLNVQRMDHGEWLDAAVSASTGEVLSVANWVAHATYEVFEHPKESPYDGDRTIAVDPHDDIASPFWLA